MWQIDETGVTPDLGARLLWQDLKRASVLVLHTPEEELYYVLEGPDGKLTLRTDDPMAPEVLAGLQKQPGFNHEVWLESMSSSEDREYEVLARVNQEEG